MTKILDLDDFQTPEKAIRLNGKEHALRPMSVKDYIANARVAKKLEKEEDFTVHIEQLVKMILSVFPTIPEEELNALTVSQLEKIIGFAREQAEAGAPAAEEGDGKNETAKA